MADARRTGRNTDTLSSAYGSGIGEEPIQPPSDASALHDSVSIEVGKPQKPRFFSQMAAGYFMAYYGIWGGFTLAYSAVGIPSFLEDPNRPFVMSKHAQAWFRGIFNLTGVFGALGSSLVSTYFSKKWAMILMLIPMNAMWLMVIFPLNEIMMVASRAIMGFFGCTYLALAQIYTSEVAHKSLRGLLLSFTMIFIGVGQLFGYTLGAYMEWKALGITFLALSIFLMPPLVLLPETPVHYLRRCDEKNALKSVRWLCGEEFDCECEVDDIKHHLAEAEERQPSLREMMNARYVWPLFIAAFIVVLRQFTGHFAITSYTVQIFQASGGAVAPKVATIVIGVVVLLFTILSAVMTDRIGRRKLAVFSAFMLILGHGTMGTYFYFKDKAAGFGWVPLLALVVCVAAFSLGIGTLMYMVVGELIPVQVKNQVTGVLCALGNISQAGAVASFEYMRTGMGEAPTFWFFSIDSAILFLFCLLALPETKGRSLREIETDLTANSDSEVEPQGGAAGQQQRRPRQDDVVDWDRTEPETDTLTSYSAISF